MGLKDSFNQAVVDFIDLIYVAKCAALLKIETLRRDVDKKEIDEAINGFTGRQDAYLEFVHNNTSETSVKFSDTLLNKYEENNINLKSWTDYFSLIKETINNLSTEDDSFLGQFKYRTELFEDFYKSKNEDIKYLLDIFVGENDIYELGLREPKAANIIDARKKLSSNQNPSPKF